MRASFACGLAALMISGTATAQTRPVPDSGELPPNGGTVIDKTRPGAPRGEKASPSASAASAAASAPSGVPPMRHPTGKATR